MTPFGPVPGMPGGPPIGSAEGVAAQTWWNQQQYAAWAAAQARPVVVPPVQVPAMAPPAAIARTAETQGLDLTGTWVSEDYECPWTVRQTESVAVVHDGELVAATKLTGDACVPAHHLTFAGRLPVDRNAGSILWTAGTPQSPASATAFGHIILVDRSTFSASAGWGRQLFRRAMPDVRPRSFGTGRLTGVWVSDDYECPWTVKQTEFVTVVHDGELVAATKLTGDACVPAHHLTFAGRLPVDKNAGTVLWTTGLPDRPASGVAMGRLAVTGSNTFAVDHIRFRRHAANV